jgi:hypothetical protein
MNREEFKAFVEQTLEKVICFAEAETGQKLSRQFCFHWFGHAYEKTCRDISEHITQRIYIDENHIYPCVDIGVTDILESGTLIISAGIAGYSPRQFQKNWTDREGPFVYIVGQRVFDKLGRV